MAFGFFRSGSQAVRGVPPGGTTGQVLSKNSNANYDVEWSAAGGPGGTGVGAAGANIDSDGIILSSFGVTSVNHIGTGQYQVNLSNTSLDSTNAVAVVTPASTNGPNGLFCAVLPNGSGQYTCWFWNTTTEVNTEFSFIAIGL